MSATYFWYQDKLVVINRQLFASDFSNAALHKYKYYPCVDGYESGPTTRYGFWAVDDTLRDWPALWESCTPASFPDEFRAHLLLLGVS